MPVLRLSQDSKLPADTEIGAVSDFTGIYYRSPEKQPNGLPRFSAGVIGADAAVAERLLLETLKSGDPLYDEVNRKMSWQ